jgi:hypothetical protein
MFSGVRDLSAGRALNLGTCLGYGTNSNYALTAQVHDKSYRVMDSCILDPQSRNVYWTVSI